MEDTTKCQGCGVTITPANASHCETCAEEEIAEAALVAEVQKALMPYVVSGQLRPKRKPAVLTGNGRTYIAMPVRLNR